LYLVLNVRSVCPIYFNGQSMHLIWHTPLFSYSSRCRRGFTKFSMVFFFVRNAILIFVSLKRFAIYFLIHNTTKWDTFIHNGKETRKITNSLKNHK
jgi:hypothetical protein